LIYRALNFRGGGGIGGARQQRAHAIQTSHLEEFIRQLAIYIKHPLRRDAGGTRDAAEFSQDLIFLSREPSPHSGEPLCQRAVSLISFDISGVFDLPLKFIVAFITARISRANGTDGTFLDYMIRRGGY